MLRKRGLHPDLIIGLGLLLLAILFFAPVTVGGKTLIPADNVFAWQPWSASAAELGISAPHNSLLSDLLLQNYVWKRFIVASLRARQLPLWNPYILGGVPFLAAGQHSAMYPLSVIFYVLPLTAAYGWFAALHLYLAGQFTYLLARTLRVRRMGAALAAVTFMLCGMTATHNVFPMIMAALVWLPLILALLERLVVRAEEGHAPLLSYLPDLMLGAVAFGMVFLAGHPEMYYYVALSAGLFALWRLAGLGWRTRRFWRMGSLAVAMLVMVVLGAGLGGAQWLPLLDVVRYNFREGSTTFKQVLEWAYPLRRLIALLIPDFYGNPSHHQYFDLFTGRMTPVTINVLGQRIDNITWGVKNYVEGASYLGLLPTALAIVPLLRRKGRHRAFFAILAAFSLLFAFGSPLYIIVYALPGLNQVHSPFRWIYPYSLSMALLAGMGLQALWEVGAAARSRWARWADGLATRALPLALVGCGAALLVGLAVSLPLKERLVRVGEWAIHHLALAERAFADGRMFYSYQFRNLAILALALTLSGLLLALRPRFRRAAVWGGLAVAITLAELFAIGWGFFPAVDTKLVGLRTPGIDYLRADPELYRITSFVGGDEKTMNANTPSFYDIADVRGYDSIIPKQYVEYMRLIQEQNELLANRIAPITANHPEALDSPLLDLLNVKYVVTAKERTIPNAHYTLVYDGEMRIYRNDDAMPRAFLVTKAISIPDAAARAQALRTLNLRETVIVERDLAQSLPAHVPAGATVRVDKVDYSPNEVSVHVHTSVAAMLVLGDSYAPGWRAFVRRADATNPSQDEKEVTLYRADGNFRAVEVPAGEHVVRFKYSPDVVKFGLYITFLAATVLILAAGAWAWLRLTQGKSEEAPEQRVTKNTIAPILLSLINKVIDMAFAMLMLRILGPADAGEFYFAVVVIGWFDILTNFGLNTLITREVAKDKTQANRYLSNATMLRLGLCVASVPVLSLFFLLRRSSAPLNPATVLAIVLFGVSLVPSNISASLSAVFTAYERMEIPAALTTLTTLLKVSAGMVALIAGWGYVGLAGVSIGVNLATLAILYVLVHRMLFRPRLEVDLPFQKRMFQDSYPLMINNLLATLFFKVAVLLLEWTLKDPRIIGWYSTAYKYIDAVGIIPAYFTIAIFPMMSRYAATAKGSLLRAYRLAIKLLLIIAAPCALLGCALSRELIMVLGGAEYLPQAALILQVMIWYMPFGFINSVTQYVLIALGQQRFLTRAFAIGLAFSVVANLVAINRFGYMASAYIAILAEIVLFVPFYIGIRRHLAHMPWLRLAGKQALSILPMAGLFLFLPHQWLAVSAIGGMILYVVGLAVLRVFDSEEQEVMGRVLPVERLWGRMRTALSRAR